MASNTPFLNLRKPDPDPETGDFVSVELDLNENFDKIDEAMQARTVEIATVASDLEASILELEQEIQNGGVEEVTVLPMGSPGKMVILNPQRTIWIYNSDVPGWFQIVTKNLLDARFSQIRSGIYLRRSSASPQSFTSGTEATLNWDTLVRADGAYSDPFVGGVTSITQVTLTENGLYSAGASGRWGGHATGYRRMSLYVAGTLADDQAAPSIGTSAHPLSVSHTFYGTAGQTVDIRATQTSGTNLSFSSTSMTPNFYLWRIPSLHYTP